ncbi:MAG: caspase family protein [Saprospiraceae bacterium]
MTISSLSICISGQKNTYALLAGVGKYPVSSKWPNLSSVNDIKLLSSSLQFFGIPSENIKLMKDDEITRGSLLRMIESSLTNKVKAGDFAIFHFSGHGQQIPDQNGDEADGLDEALVPNNSPKYFSKGIYEGENLILDDDLAFAFNKLRKKLGPTGRLLVTLDACHSGTATRGLQTARGTDIIMAEEGFSKKNLQESKELILLDNELSNSAPDLAPEISFYSSSPEQLSYEYSDSDSKTYGLFTYALCKNLQAMNSDDTYQILADKIKLFIATQSSLQTPYSEGRIQETIFGRNIKSPSTYYLIKKILNPQLILISAGRLHGITIGSRIGVYELEHGNFSKPIVTGSIEDVDLLQADLKLDKKWKAVNSKNYAVRVISYSFNESPLKINLNSSSKQKDKNLKKKINSKSNIDWTNKNPDLNLNIQLKDKEIFQIHLDDLDGNIYLDEICTSTYQLDSIYNKIDLTISQFERAKRLTELESKDNFFKADIQLLIQDSTGNFVSSNSNTYLMNDIVKLQIRNKGTKAFYCSVFHIRSDLSIRPIILDEGHYVSPVSIAAGSSISSEFIISRPLGKETLKLICTNDPVYFGPSIRGKSIGTNNPVQALINELYDPENQTRGTSSTISTEQAYIGTMIFFSK